MEKWHLWIFTVVATNVAILGAISAAYFAHGGRGGLHPHPRILTTSSCSCDEDFSPVEEGVARCQLASDFLIALAYFSIPLELVYFFLRSRVFPHRGVLLQFGLFIVLCGLTHFVSIWTYGPHSLKVALSLTILKIVTAAVSCGTAFLLFRIIPAILNIKVRELFLVHKAAQLDSEMGLIRRAQAVRRHISAITTQIRASLDRKVIFETALYQLSHTLGLSNCAIWSPGGDGSTLELCLALQEQPPHSLSPIPLSDAVLSSIGVSSSPVYVPVDSRLARASIPQGAPRCPVAAIRVPLNPAHPPPADCPEPFVVLVLVLPPDPTRPCFESDELILVEEIAGEMAIALSHASQLEEMQQQCDQLAAVGRTMAHKSQLAESTLLDQSDFLRVLSQELREPLQPITGLASLLREQVRKPPQASLLDSLLVCSSLLSANLSDIANLVSSVARSYSNNPLAPAPFEVVPLFCVHLRQLAYTLAQADRDSQLWGAGLMDLRVEFALGVPAIAVGDRVRILQLAVRTCQLALLTGCQHSPCQHVILRMKVAAEAAPQPAMDASRLEGAFCIRVDVTEECAEQEAARLPGPLQAPAEAAGRHEEVVKLLENSTQRLAESIHGEFWMCGEGSAKPSAGFRVLVGEAPERASTESESDSWVRKELQGVAVLVAEDAECSGVAYSALLSSLGCKVRTASSIVDCLALAVSQKGSAIVDVVVLEVKRPDLAGLHLARRIAHLCRPEVRPGLIGIIGPGDSSLEDLCESVGVDHVLTLPVSYRDLGEALADVLKRAGRSRDSRVVLEADVACD